MCEDRHLFDGNYSEAVHHANTFSEKHHSRVSVGAGEDSTYAYYIVRQDGTFTDRNRPGGGEFHGTLKPASK